MPVNQFTIIPFPMTLISTIVDSEDEVSSLSEELLAKLTRFV